MAFDERQVLVPVGQQAECDEDAAEVVRAPGAAASRMGGERVQIAMGEELAEGGGVTKEA
ncbi:hypothetical protein ACWCYZ_44490 [Streptomyces virginiae]